jgi:hypothetical protein
MTFKARFLANGTNQRAGFTLLIERRIAMPTRAALSVKDRAQILTSSILYPNFKCPAIQ